ncbi:putative pre-mRNA-splicing factor ATP-dependent RNA helicase DHX16 [Trichogramma pretiosum]|uniref:putative pre-mRNA-splicing factor ATP-dependent RNA helicase DHX16 n=1 Tax=Trichogramma pretiosum TaxID=7493 RepID=UPI0006C9992F|nr:putative pre-mRNA-splicing factor ATP-dependent RNA helicase DHX16 [Trichogramma pretiosum]
MSESSSKCCVSGCKSKSKKGNCLTFHRFPFRMESRLRNVVTKWKKALKIEKVSDSMRVCSRHFKKTDFHTSHVPGQDRLLKSSAVPSRNLSKARVNKTSDKISNEISDEISNENSDKDPDYDKFDERFNRSRLARFEGRAARERFTKNRIKRSQRLAEKLEKESQACNTRERERRKSQMVFLKFGEESQAGANQRIAHESEEETHLEPNQSIAHESEDENRIEPNQSVAHESEEENRIEPHQSIAHESVEENRIEPNQNIVDEKKKKGKKKEPRKIVHEIKGNKNKKAKVKTACRENRMESNQSMAHEREEDIIRFRCNSCLKGFEEQIEFHEHIREKHQNVVERYECKSCNISFRHEKYIMRHNIIYKCIGKRV